MVYVEELEPYDIKIQSEAKCLEKKCSIDLGSEAEERFRIFIWSNSDSLHEKSFNLILQDTENGKIYKERNIFVFN